MPRDYKNINKKKEKTTSTFSVLLTFITGLTVGIFIAFVLYLNYQKPVIKNQAISPTANTNKSTETRQADEQGAEDSPAIPRPKFDFYKILPTREVNISEWVAEEQENQSPDVGNTTMYILQVGSFKKYEAADQVKAKLALLGISADIQRVVINGQDIHHRVRIGPYKDSARFIQDRKLLEENGLSFMTLKLTLEEAEPGKG